MTGVKLSPMGNCSATGSAFGKSSPEVSFNSVARCYTFKIVPYIANAAIVAGV
jgi:hypothetical protein